jgi:two-component system chemotaxis response regulator CheB
VVSATLSRERPPPVEAVVIGGSAGALAILGEILPGLPEDFLPVLIVVHVLASAATPLASVFARRCAARVVEAEPDIPIERGGVYFAPADYHLLVEPTRRCALSIEPPVLFSRPSIDVLFESAADVYGPALAGLVLTGASADGALGLRALRHRGGRAMVQDPATAEAVAMPEAALAAVSDARVIPLSEMLTELLALDRV